MVRCLLHFKSLYTVIEQLFREDLIFLTIVNLLKARVAVESFQSCPCHVHCFHKIFAWIVEVLLSISLLLTLTLKAQSVFVNAQY